MLLVQCIKNVATNFPKDCIKQSASMQTHDVPQQIPFTAKNTEK